MTRSSRTRSSLSPAHDGFDSRDCSQNPIRGLRSSAASRIRRFLGREQSGSVATEFAMVLPIFIALLFGIMQVALILHADMTLSQAMRDGARFAIVNGASSATPATKAQVEAAAKQAASLLDQAHLTVLATWIPDNLPGSRVLVAGSYIFDFHVPLFGHYPITLNGSSQLTIHN